MKKLSKYKYHIYIITCFVVVFALIALPNTNDYEVSQKFIELLDSYEGSDIFDYKEDESGQACLESYDVGDGVVTFGYGNTFADEESGIEYINELTGKSYELNDCILIEDLKSLQSIAIDEREDDVNNLSSLYNTKLTQEQFDGIMLMYYLNESAIKDDDFWELLNSNELSYESYISYFTQYFSKFENYDEYKEGWNLRIKDSAELFFYGDYERDY